MSFSLCGRKICWLGLCLLSLVSTVRAEVTTLAAQSLREYVKQTQGRQAYGLYVGGQKAGWMVFESKLGKRGEMDVAIISSQEYISLHLAGAKTTMRSKQSTYYGLEGDGPIVFVSKETVEDGKAATYLAQRQSDGLLITTHRDGREVRRKKVQTQDNLAAQKKFGDWLTSSPAPNAEFWTPSLTIEKEHDEKYKQVYKGAQTIAWGGVPTEVYTLDMYYGGAPIEMEVKANGFPLRGKFGGLIDFRAEEEAVAKKMDGQQIDLLAASLIPVDRDLGESGKVRSLRIELSGLGSYTLPTSHRQVISRRGEGVLEVEMRRDFRLPGGEPLSPDERLNALKATTTLNADDPAIEKLARQIVGEERSPLLVAEALQKWVFKNLRKSMAANASSATEVLAARAGDCTEHTLLFVALARAVGLPARDVGGIMYAPADRPIFGWHAWAEVHDGQQWVSVDPTWDQVWVDATHIKFSSGEDDFAWIGVLGRLKLNVLDFATQAS